MSAVEEVRRAAALMRERAQAATPGAWRDSAVDGSNRYAALVSDVPPRRPGGGEGWHYEADYGGYLIGESLTKHDRAHIASWSPPVALAVANWLDDAANWAEEEEAHFLSDRGPLAVVRAYLGTPDRVVVDDEAKP
ncbi:MAG: hypothetical protein ACREF4_13675 [Gammaproteobacteria bacterium]